MALNELAGISVLHPAGSTWHPKLSRAAQMLLCRGSRRTRLPRLKQTTIKIDESDRFVHSRLLSDYDHAGTEPALSRFLRGH